MVAHRQPLPSTPPARATLFTHQRILELRAQAIQTDLARDRRTLLAGINKAFTESLPLASDPSAQILEDLSAMNHAGRLADGTLPLELWLETACALTAARVEGEFFRSALTDLLALSATRAESFSPAGDFRAVTRSLPSPPSYPDAETRRLSEKLEDAQARKWEIAQVGGSTTEIDEEIRELRRQLREGGQLKAGDSLGDGRYLLLERLGRGGFAVVWKAHDRGRNERVAVKVLHSEIAGDPVRKARFFRGARVMASLEHSAVVRVLEPHAEDSGYHYFVMELVAGGDLRHAVLQGRLADDRVIPVILSVGEAVAIAHQRGLVHRDIKPANILLDEAGAPKLSDFDLVGGKETTGGTRTGPMGTMFYAAPEAMKNAKEADARADVYSLGMTAVFALSGAELPMEVLRDTDRVIDGLAKSDAVKAVLKRAAAWDSEQRYPDAGAFCDALRLASSEAASKPVAPPREGGPPPLVERPLQEGSKKPLLARIFFVVVVIIGVVAAGSLGVYFGYIKPKRIQEQHMAERAEMDAKLKKLKAEYDQEMAKVQKLLQELSQARDEGVRLRVQKQLDDAMERARALNNKAGGGFSSQRPPCNCVPGDPLCICL